jgi:hypothetical protein
LPGSNRQESAKSVGWLRIVDGELEIVETASWFPKVARRDFKLMMIIIVVALPMLLLLRRPRPIPKAAVVALD